MYPQPPPQHRPTNYYWVLLACMAAMLLFLFVGLRQIASRFSATGSDQAPLITEAPRASAKPALTVAPQATATVAASAAPAATATAEGGVVDVDAKSLTQSPANYRSRLVRVRGTVFYTGKLENGKTWIQIVGPDNVYVDGQLADPLPAGVAKGVQVELTGIGAGLTSITAANGQDYDQAYIDPVQKVDVVK